MQMDNKKVFTVMGVVALFLVSMIISQYYNALNKAELVKKRKAEYGSLQFSGKVSSYKVYRYMNKNYYKICVKLDSPNVKPMHIFDDDDAINIKGGIATFSAGYLNHILGPADSVAVNAGNSGKIVFHYAANVLDERTLGFDPMGLRESDLLACN
jgi:hypothetical protein